MGAAVVAAAFSVATWRTASTDDTALRVWSIALAQFGFACGAMVWGSVFGWTPLVYRLFYLFGAVLNVAWLGLGTIWLLAPATAATVVTIVFVGVAAVASASVMATDLLPEAGAVLGTQLLPEPRRVMPASVRTLSRLFSIAGSAVILGGLGWSIARRRRPVGLVLLALGVVIAAAASEFGRAGLVAPFSVGLAIGIAVMFAGFVKASR